VAKLDEYTVNITYELRRYAEDNSGRFRVISRACQMATGFDGAFLNIVTYVRNNNVLNNLKIVKIIQIEKILETFTP
jgi:hypothetical protein